MTWLRAHYDRVALLAAGLFLFASSLLILRNVWQSGEKLSGLQAPVLPKPAPTTFTRVAYLEVAGCYRPRLGRSRYSPPASSSARIAGTA